MIDFSEGRYFWYLAVALIVSGAMAAGLSYWAAMKFISYTHAGDPLQAKGGLKPDQREALRQGKCQDWTAAFERKKGPAWEPGPRAYGIATAWG